MTALTLHFVHERIKLQRAAIFSVSEYNFSKSAYGIDRINHECERDSVCHHRPIAYFRALGSATGMNLIVPFLLEVPFCVPPNSYITCEKSGLIIESITKDGKVLYVTIEFDETTRYVL